MIGLDPDADDAFELLLVEGNPLRERCKRRRTSVRDPLARDLGRVYRRFTLYRLLRVLELLQAGGGGSGLCAEYCWRDQAVHWYPGFRGKLLPDLVTHQK